MGNNPKPLPAPVVPAYVAPTGAVALANTGPRTACRTGMLVLANGSVGMVPPANSMPRCGGTIGGGASAKLHPSNTIACGKTPNQAFTALNGGCSVQPCMLGTGNAVIFGGQGHRTVGVHGAYGYTSPQPTLPPTQSPIGLHLTPLALGGLQAAGQGKAPTPQQANALAPLVAWATASGALAPVVGATA